MLRANRGWWLGLVALAFPVPALAADVVVTDGTGATITLQLNLVDSISLTIGGRTDVNTIAAGTGSGTVDFGSQAVDGTALAGTPTTDMFKKFYTTPGSALFGAQLDATVYFTGAGQVDMQITGTTSTGSGTVTGWFLCNPAAIPTTAWDAEPTAATHQALGTETACHIFTTEGSAQTINVDLGILAAPNATGAPTGNFVFTTAAG